MTRVTGSCLCKQVAYECDDLDGEIINCHCTTCRKAHAAPYAANARVLREHFRWLKGSERLSTYESSPGKIRYFCSGCGSHLLAERPAQSHVIVRVSTLDDDPGQSPRAHIWCSLHAPWLEEPETILHYPEWQPER
ncbi:GFA family protein [Tatumella terrea]|uniref:GFA family protein n=1 Tax=Tatumella terrea TaxID=419007 RepID=A0ABW1VW45_9GAMM